MKLTKRYYVYCDGAEGPEGWPRCRWLTVVNGCLKGHEITHDPDDFGADGYVDEDGIYVCGCKDYEDGDKSGLTG